MLINQTPIGCTVACFKLGVPETVMQEILTGHMLLNGWKYNRWEVRRILPGFVTKGEIWSP